MNEKELQILIDDLGRLDPDNTEPDIFLKTIERIEATQLRVIEDIRRNVSPEIIEELGLGELLKGAGLSGAAPAAPTSGGFTVEVIPE